MQETSFPHPNLRGLSAVRVAAQCVNSPENLPEGNTAQSVLTSVQPTTADPVPESINTVCKSATLTGIQGNPEVPALAVSAPPAQSSSYNTSSTLIGVQPNQEALAAEAVTLPIRSDSTGVLGMPENILQFGEPSDKLPDIIVNRPDGDATVEIPNPPANRDPVKTFNVDPLSTEDEMDAVDALLS